MLIDGKLLSQKILEDLKKRVSNLEEKKHVQPHLGVIVVGEDPATASYVRQKKKMGEQIGGIVSVYNYPANVSQHELETNIDFLQTNGDLHGLIIQLPLPQQLNEQELTNRVDADKDVDGFREDSDFDEPIAIAVMRILEEIYDLEQAKDSAKNSSLSKVEGQNFDSFQDWLRVQKIVVMGKGKTGGKPIITIMRKFGINPTIVDSKTENRDEITRSADILVCAVGGRGTIVNESMIKKDAILIGIGMSLGADGKLHGDYESEEIATKASYYTPIPGGVGPVNAAMLLVNVVDAAERSTQN